MDKRFGNSKARHYRALIERQQHSGLTISRFCAKHRISSWTFYHWRKRVSKDFISSRPKRDFDPQPVRRFIPIKVAQDPVPDTNAAAAEIVFENSIRVKIPSGYPCLSIRAIVEALHYGRGAV